MGNHMDWLHASISRGRIIVHAMHLVLFHDDVIIYDIDTVSKYVESTYAQSSKHTEVILCDGERTIDIDESMSRSTGIAFNIGYDDWSVLVSSSRYTTRVVFYKLPHHSSGWSPVKLIETD